MSTESSSQSYGGAERRRHKVYVTHNTEYHTRDNVCIGVRDRKTGNWNQTHTAIGHRMTGSLHKPEFQGDMPFRTDPVPGDTVVFDAGKHQVITSALERVTRPPEEIVKKVYPN